MTMKQTLTSALLALLTAGVQAQTDWQQRVDTELSVTLDDLKRVARTWLVPEKASTAVVTSPENRARAEKLGLNIQEL